MKKDVNLIYLFIFIILNLAYIVAFSTGISIVGRPLTSDPQMHIEITEAWLAGENPLTNEEYFFNPFPYPPAFHVTIAVLSKVLFTSPVTIFNFLQIFLFSLILTSTLYLVCKVKNFYVGILTVCLLISGIAFWDRSSQAIPNGIDALIFPMIIYFFIRDRKRIFIILSTFLVYNHLFYGMMLLFSLVGYSIKYNRERLRDFGIVGLLCLPLFLLYVPYLGGFIEFGTGGETSVAQYKEAVGHPLYNMAYLGYFLSIISFFSILHFSTKKLSDFERMLLFWVIALVPLYVIFPHRGLPYLAHPLSIMGAITLDDYTKNKRQKYIVLLILFLIACLYIVAEYSIIGFTTSFYAQLIAYLLRDSFELIVF